MNPGSRSVPALLLFSCLFSAGPAHASAAGPDPRDLLEKAGKAAAKVSQVRYDYTYAGTGSLAGSFSGRVSLLKDGGLLLSASLTGRSSAGDADAAVDMVIASNGRRIEVLDSRRHTFSYGTLPGAAHLLGYAYYAVLFQLVRDEPFAPELSGPVHYEGTESIHGVPCHVVRAQNNSFGSADVWWYLGKDDLLPRGQRWQVTTPGVNGGFRFEIEELDLHPGLDADAVDLRAPEGYRTIDEDERLVAAGHPAPDWTLKSVSGESVSLSSLGGQVVVLDFWASWCPPCWSLMPAFDAVARAYADRPVTFLGINSWESPEVDPAAFIDRKKVTYRTLLRGETIASDYKIGSLPALFVIDTRGQLVLVRSPAGGSVEELVTSLRSAIDKALGD